VLYRAAAVMLVTPIRDGMNLVAKEFVASRVAAYDVHMWSASFLQALEATGVASDEL
jgi:trehalose-6-phosphate synthase